ETAGPTQGPHPWAAATSGGGSLVRGAKLEIQAANERSVDLEVPGRVVGEDPWCARERGDPHVVAIDGFLAGCLDELRGSEANHLPDAVFSLERFRQTRER